ncbi:MAG: nitroreductase family deazaflavin-dependent oxidoreductase [Deltaproteobacteria bacterium]|nr:nitroreductase family deazaflavin-dependent oxidoreductase [Deltaproteobacteria bacterium]
MRNYVLSLLVALATSGCNGPFGLLPGGALEGEARPLPPEWSFAGDYGTAQLQTKPEEPYSVNRAYTIVGGVLYVNAGGTETQWVQNIAANPLVRLRLDGGLYDLRAERVTDSDEVAAFSGAWTGQSMFRRDPLTYDEVWIYRLVSR